MQQEGPRSSADTVKLCEVSLTALLEPGDGGGHGGVGGLEPLVAGAAGLQAGDVVQEGVAQLEVQQVEVGRVPVLLHPVQHGEQRRLGRVGVHGEGSLHGGEQTASGVVAEYLHKLSICDEDYLDILGKYLYHIYLSVQQQQPVLSFPPLDCCYNLK